MLAKELCVRAAQAHDVTFAALEPSSGSFSSEVNEMSLAGVSLVLPADALSRWQKLRFLSEVFASQRPDLVFAHSVIPAAYARLACGPLGRRRVIPVLHSASNDDYADGLLNATEAILRWRAAHVVAVTEQQARAYRRRFPGAAVTVIPNGIDLDKYRRETPKRDATRLKLGLNAGDKLILQVGRISPVKRQLLTAQSVAEILRRDQSSHLWFAGLTDDEDYRLRLEKAIAPFPKQARLLGSREDIPELLSAADVFAMPSTHEAHSVGMIEALASGVAIVATDIDAFRFASGMGEVELIPVDDSAALHRGIRDALSARRFAHREISSLDISVTARNYDALAAELVSVGGDQGICNELR